MEKQKTKTKSRKNFPGEFIERPLKNKCVKVAKNIDELLIATVN